MSEPGLSILFPVDDNAGFRQLPDVAWHDTGMDIICNALSPIANEQRMIMKIMTNMTADPAVAKYRADVFDDILRFPELRQELMELLEKIDFLKEYAGFAKDYDDSDGMWDLLHRLDELNQYIQCVEAIHHCLDGQEICSEALTKLRDYVVKIYEDSGFEELKADIRGLKADTSNLKSVTVGINLNERFEAMSIGLISVNSKPFTKSGALSNFQTKFSRRDEISDSLEWKENYKYHQADMGKTGFENLRSMALFAGSLAAVNPFALAGTAMLPTNDPARRILRPLDEQINGMLAVLVRKLRSVLTRHVTVSLYEIANLIPEFVYYVRWAEYIEKLTAKGMNFCKPQAVSEDGPEMDARGIYNMKLAESVPADEIIPNDLGFDPEHRVYILTGANRGGKTTITQTIGQLYIMAQGGVYVTGNTCTYRPVDCVYTHFPADEDKTMDYGRLGEECQRFRELYQSSTKDSLLLLNESFATTSFEEGYYIARDSVRAILAKGVRTIYNTHMHKLAYDIEEINTQFTQCKAASLIVESQDGNRSYKVRVAPPEGSSYAKDIAEKYGVTYEMLLEEQKTYGNEKWDPSALVMDCERAK